VLILAGILIGKHAIVFLTAWLLRLPLRACLIAGFALSQVGEFSFVLLYAVQGTGLLDNFLQTSIVSAAVLSMFITPFVMSYGPKLATGLGRFTRLKGLIEADSAEDASETLCKLCDHVIVAGYGFAGRELSQALDRHGIPYVIVDLNIENVNRASREGARAVFGDVTSDPVLSQLGIESARELVLLINDPAASEHSVRVARRLAPQLFITVRTAYLLDIESLLAAGADEVVPAEREAAVQVAAGVLKRHRLDVSAITEQASQIRDHSEDDNG
jgi:CPA2 family monovalent cation:H+ antiporter-2